LTTKNITRNLVTKRNNSISPYPVPVTPSRKFLLAGKIGFLKV